jgi:hypothetical protein
MFICYFSRFWYHLPRKIWQPWAGRQTDRLTDWNAFEVIKSESGAKILTSKGASKRFFYKSQNCIFNKQK